jgi:hypothetical protein
LSSAAFADCDFQILGASQDNVGTYDCDGYGTCVLVESYFDASAPYTPIDPLEEIEINIAPENPNSIQSNQGAATDAKAHSTGPAPKASATTRGWCNGGTGGGGGGGGSGAPTLPPVFGSAYLPFGRYTIRPYYPLGGTGGSPGDTGTRAAREKKKRVQVNAECGLEYEPRANEAQRAIVNANNYALPPAGTRFIGQTLDGYDETWMVTSTATSALRVGLVESSCPGGGGV